MIVCVCCVVAEAKLSRGKSLKRVDALMLSLVLAPLSFVALPLSLLEGERQRASRDGIRTERTYATNVSVDAELSNGGMQTSTTPS